jgi:hypothetical protein
VDAEERTPPVENEERTAPATTSDQPHAPTKDATPAMNTKQQRHTEQRDRATSMKGLHAQRDANYSYCYGFTQHGTSALPNGMTWDDIYDAIENMPPPPSSPAPSDDNDINIVRKAIFGLVFTQMSAKKGIQKHSQVAIDALKRELEQFKHMDVFEPLDAFILTEEQKAEALRVNKSHRRRLSIIYNSVNGHCTCLTS